MQHELDKYSKTIDHALQFSLGKLTHGLSPAALMLAFADWYSHLLMHPAKQIALLDQYIQSNLQLTKIAGNAFNGHSIQTKKPITNCQMAQDKRFIATEWQQYPFLFYYHAFLMMQSLWHEASTHVHGVSKHHEEVVDFTVRQWLDIFSPSNSPFTNPEIQKAAWEQKGENFIRGFGNAK